VAGIKITQLGPSGVSGRRYGLFDGRVEAVEPIRFVLDVTFTASPVRPTLRIAPPRFVLRASRPVLIATVTPPRPVLRAQEPMLEFIAGG
jgi:hypothetical protein